VTGLHVTTTSLQAAEELIELIQIGKIRTNSLLSPSLTLSTVDSSVLSFCTFFGFLGAEFIVFGASSLVAGKDTRRLDLRGSPTGTPLSSSFAFRLGIFVVCS
jgi:hypothetical protein